MPATPRLQVLSCAGKMQPLGTGGNQTLSADAISAFANSNRSASRSCRDGDSVALHLRLLEPPASRIASFGQTAELSLLPALAVPHKVAFYVSLGCGKRWEMKMLPANASRMARTSSLAILDFTT